MGYSDEEDISKLSSLQSKVEQAIMDEQDSDINDSDSSLSDIDVKSPEINQNLDEPIRYSLSTTVPAIGTPQTSNQIIIHNAKHRGRGISNGSGSNIYSADHDDVVYNLSDHNINYNANDHDDIYQNEEEEEEDEEESDEFKDDKFNIISLIATCKYLAEEAGNGITEIYHVIDNCEHVKYGENRSFKDIDQHWIQNRKKLTAGKNASARG